jgi:hypothetical protein
MLKIGDKVVAIKPFSSNSMDYEVGDILYVSGYTDVFRCPYYLKESMMARIKYAPFHYKYEKLHTTYVGGDYYEI